MSRNWSIYQDHDSDILADSAFDELLQKMTEMGYHATSSKNKFVISTEVIAAKVLQIIESKFPDAFKEVMTDKDIHSWYKKRSDLILRENMLRVQEQKKQREAREKKKLVASKLSDAELEAFGLNKNGTKKNKR